MPVTKRMLCGNGLYKRPDKQTKERVTHCHNPKVHAPGGCVRARRWTRNLPAVQHLPPCLACEHVLTLTLCNAGRLQQRHA